MARIYYSMDAAWERKKALRDDTGELELKQLTFYLETPEIREDYDHNPDSDWWLLDEFDTIEQAEDWFYTEEGLAYWEWRTHP